MIPNYSSLKSYFPDLLSHRLRQCILSFNNQPIYPIYTTVSDPDISNSEHLSSLSTSFSSHRFLQTTKQISVIFEEQTIFSTVLWSNFHQYDSIILQLLKHFSFFLLTESTIRLSSSNSDCSRLQDHDISIAIKTISTLCTEFLSRFSTQFSPTLSVESSPYWDQCKSSILRLFFSSLNFLGRSITHICSHSSIPLSPFR